MDTNSKTKVFASNNRASAILAQINRVHLSDQKRIAAGELKGSDLFFISREIAKDAKVTWNFGRRRSA